MSSHYIDTSIFLTFLNKENTDLDYFKGVVEILKEPTYNIKTSTITLIEILQKKEYASEYVAIQEFIIPRSIPVNSPIAKLAGNLRSGIYDGIEKLKLINSIHAASAIANGCQCLYTQNDDILNLGNKESIFKIPNVGEVKIIKPTFQNIL